MKKISLITAFLFSGILPPGNVNGKCMSYYCKYSFLHSLNYGSVPWQDTSFVIALDAGDTIQVVTGAYWHNIYSECPHAMEIYLYRDTILLQYTMIHPDTMLIFNPGNYRVGFYVNPTFCYYFNVISVTGIYENVSIIPLNIFPNPASDEVTLHFNEEADYVIALQNVVGEILFQTANSSSEIKFDVAGLRKGIYFVTVTDENKNSVVRKIVKM